MNVENSVKRALNYTLMILFPHHLGFPSTITEELHHLQCDCEENHNDYLPLLVICGHL